MTSPVRYNKIFNLTSLRDVQASCCQRRLRDHLRDLPTYPGVPHAVAIILPSSSVLDNPKSLIIILESSSGLIKQKKKKDFNRSHQ